MSKASTKNDELLFEQEVDAPNEDVARLYVLAAIRQAGYPDILKAEKATRFEVKLVRT